LVVVVVDRACPGFASVERSFNLATPIGNTINPVEGSGHFRSSSGQRSQPDLTWAQLFDVTLISPSPYGN
jgi:hypothetical protein